MLYSLGLRLLRDKQLAEDLVQDTFLIAYRKWDQFKGESAPSTWLYTIAVRRAQRMMRLRAGQPRQMVSLSRVHPFFETTVPAIKSNSDGPLEQQFSREAVERVDDAIAELPETFRLALVLKDIAELPGAEVAHILGIKEATVKTRVHRARLMLRKALVAPMRQRAAPEPLYPRQMCLDLLHAKQEALDRGVAFSRDDIICERCRNVFTSLDLTKAVCGRLGSDQPPARVRKAVETGIAALEDEQK